MNDRKKALAAINRALEKRHNIPELLFRKAEVLYKAKDFSECMEICYKLFTADKEFFYAYMLHSKALEAKGKASSDPLMRGISGNPHNIILLEALAMNYMQAGDFIKALAAYDLVLSKDRTNVKSMIAQGICYYKCANYDRALHCFQNAAEVNYKNPDIWILLGITHHRLNNAAVAETLFRQALSLATTNPLALVNMGVFLLEQGRLVEAQECAEKVIRLNSNYGPAWLLRARCCRTYGNIEEAQKSIRSALYFLSEEPGTLVLSGIIEYEAGELHLSMQNFKKASEHNGENPMIWFNLAFIAFKDDKIDHAFKWVNTGLTLKPVFFDALFLKALCLLELQKDQSAQPIFQQAAELDLDKYEKWKLIQSKSQNLLAPVKPLELDVDPFSLPVVEELVFPDTITIFHIGKPEDTLPLVKEL